jgi:hypothetical protein
MFSLCQHHDTSAVFSIKHTKFTISAGVYRERKKAGMNLEKIKYCRCWQNTGIHGDKLISYFDSKLIGILVIIIVIAANHLELTEGKK